MIDTHKNVIRYQVQHELHNVNTYVNNPTSLQIALKITHNSNCPIFLGFYDNGDVFVADTYTVIHVPEVEPCLNTQIKDYYDQYSGFNRNNYTAKVTAPCQ